MTTNALDLSKFNVVQFSEIPNPIAGTWYWINTSYQSVRVNDHSLSLIPGEVVNIAPFQDAKSHDPAAYGWFEGAVARGYFGTLKPVETTPKTSSSTATASTEETATTRKKGSKETA